MNLATGFRELVSVANSISKICTLKAIKGSILFQISGKIKISGWAGQKA
jgi:hypothetical protein